ncbi:MAG: hypothetical protein LUH00_05655 [Lachnospiraceae bacterium]|nr:hypothetical protein [Lachnospiraceae bacterium]
MIEQEAVLSPPARLRGLRPASAGKFPYAALRIKRKPGEKNLWLFQNTSFLCHILRVFLFMTEHRLQTDV